MYSGTGGSNNRVMPEDLGGRGGSVEAREFQFAARLRCLGLRSEPAALLVPPSGFFIEIRLRVLSRILTCAVDSRLQPASFGSIFVG